MAVFSKARAALVLFLTAGTSTLAACGSDTAPFSAGSGGRGGATTSGSGGRGASSTEAGTTSPDARSSGGAPTGGGGASGGASGCNANRGSGIPFNAGTMSVEVDGVPMSSNATILWAAGSNTLTLTATDGSSLVVIFPGCEAKSYSIPGAGPELDAISVTYTSGGGGPQWACTYEDTQLGPANCMVDVTAYGIERNTPVTGSFSGVLRLRAGAGPNTKTVSAGTFTFGRP